MRSNGGIINEANLEVLWPISRQLAAARKLAPSFENRKSALQAGPHLTGIWANRILNNCKQYLGSLGSENNSDSIIDSAATVPLGYQTSHSVFISCNIADDLITLIRTLKNVPDAFRNALKRFLEPLRFVLLFNTNSCNICDFADEDQVHPAWKLPESNTNQK
jgi:hypothetical protein